MTEPREADVVVIGLGPGGEEVAETLAKAGLDVVGIEAELVGGECPYWGCVPSKMMIRAADSLAEARRVPELSGASTVTPDFGIVAARIRDDATDNWDDTVAVDRFTGLGGTFVRGRGRLLSAHEVAVGDEVFRARRGVVIATGTTALVPGIPGLAGTPFWTNREAIAAEQPPESLIVVGGGAIGLELGQAFSRFGTEVTVVEGGPRLLPLEEPEAGATIAEVFREEGIGVLTGVSVDRVAHSNGVFSVEASGTEVRATNLLIATGRRASPAAVGAETIGVPADARALPVDGQLRVAGVDGVWAVGDITGKGAFTHVAVYQARIAVRDILGDPGPSADYAALSRVTFTDPEVGSVGLSEEQARRDGLNVAVGFTTTASSSRGWIHKAGNAGFIKVVADMDSGVLVGATSCGPVGGEVLGALAVAVSARVPIETLRHMIYAYPTFHRGIEDALADLGSG